MLSIPSRLLISACLVALTPYCTIAASGKQIFLDNKCATCHSIESQGIDRTGSGTVGGIIPPDLSIVGTKHSSSWMQSWLLKEEEMNGKKHLKKFGGSDEDLKTLTNWLASLKSFSKSKAETTPKPKPSTAKPDTIISKETTTNNTLTDTSKLPSTLTFTISKEASDTLANHDIVFNFGKYDLSEQSKYEISRVADILKRRPKLKIKIYGYSEPLESKAKVKDLGKKRADAAKKYLVTKGIDSKRLKILSAVAFEMPNGKSGEFEIGRRVKFVEMN